MKTEPQGRSGEPYKFPIIINSDSVDSAVIFLVDIQDWKRPLGINILQKLNRIHSDLPEKYKILLFTNSLSQASLKFVPNCKFQIMTRSELVQSLGEN